MDGEVGAPVGHRHFELLDEEALAADVGERLVEHAIAFGGHPEQANVTRWIQCREQRPDVLGLPQRERGFARGDREPARRLDARGRLAHVGLCVEWTARVHRGLLAFAPPQAGGAQDRYHSVTILV